MKEEGALSLGVWGDSLWLLPHDLGLNLRFKNIIVTVFAGVNG